MPKLVIFTASIGRGDEVHVPGVITAGADYVCFTDVPETVPPPWRAKPVELHSVSADPTRIARWYKIMADRHFPELGPADISIWQDSTNIAIVDYNALFEMDADLALLPHFARDCVYDEADQVSLYGLDDPAIVQLQLESFLVAGYPAHHGLHDSCFLVRRHTEATTKFNEIWWTLLSEGSRRDQLSLDYALWRVQNDCGLKCLTLDGVSRLPHIAHTVVANKYFAFQSHRHRTRPFTPWH